MLLGQIEIIHRPGDVEIGIGVEPLDKAQPLMAKIAFDLKIGVEAEGHRVARLQLAAELFGQPRFGQIGDVRGRSEEHTSELQSLMRISYAVFCLKKKNTRPNMTSK